MFFSFLNPSKIKPINFLSFSSGRVRKYFNEGVKMATLAELVK